MNNKPLPCFDELSFIFGVDLAIGDDAIQQGDAASILKGAAGGSDFMDMDAEVGESYNIPEDLDHTAVMQDIINQTELAGKRQFLYEKLAKFPELTVSQRTRAMRHLSRDDGNAHAFFQFPTAEEKLEFLWMILE
ncbi:hypothetical protein LINGRAHAP2_LOCUS32842 [Linum grandiflorum]